MSDRNRPLAPNYEANCRYFNIFGSRTGTLFEPFGDSSTNKVQPPSARSLEPHFVPGRISKGVYIRSAPRRAPSEQVLQSVHLLPVVPIAVRLRCIEGELESGDT
jgi:hypothetical protein